MFIRSITSISTISSRRINAFSNIRLLSTQSPNNNGVDIYLGNLDLSITAESLKPEIAKRYSGEFGGPRVVFNKAEKKSMGFGYITVPTMDAAQTVISTLKGMVLHDREVRFISG